jgi:putative restriction endonuclease
MDDQRVRLAAFAFLTEQTQVHGEVLSRELLAEGLLLDGQRVPLLGPQGIFKPAVLSDIPLSITTAPSVEDRPRPYEDALGEDGLLRYCYRGVDPQHRDNQGLRLAMAEASP